MQNTLEFAQDSDQQDELSAYRQRFYLPKINGKDALYFTGNSLGLQPKKTKEYIEQELKDWAHLGVEGHLHAKNQWLPYHEFLSSSYSKIIGYKETEVVVDGAIRPNTNQEILDGLKLVFDQNGTVTAGTASPLTDGASATLVCEEDYAISNNLPILARIKSIAINGCPPELMGLGPIGASLKALKRAELDINDIDIIELNEAFASQSLACIKELNINPDKVNIEGGAIAIGHPLGATGTRITAKAAYLMNKQNKQYALATQCIGLGQGIATVLEKVE